MTSLIQYLLIEHKVITSTKGAPKNIDPRILLLGTPLDDDETLALRLAISNVNLPLFELFYTHFNYLWQPSHLLTIARFLLFLTPSTTSTLIEVFLRAHTSQALFSNLPQL